MNPKIRMVLFVLGGVGVVALYALLAARLPVHPDLRDRYLLAINSRTVRDRNATDAVSAVNFDFRGFDTLGEEFILFASVVGATVLLRQAEDRPARLRPDALIPGRAAPSSDAIRLWVLGTVGPKVVLGLYLVSHGQLSPGGGFQGGVVLATAALILYLSEGFGVYRKVVPHRAIEIAEAAGAGGYIVIGLAAMVMGREFLTNTMPRGAFGDITAGGTMPLISATTGLEVAAGFTLLIFGFLQETLLPATKKER